MVPQITLLELNKNIQESLKNNFPASIWVIAEISEIKVNKNGHCYIELIEKDLINDSIIAKSRATIWAFTYRMLKPYFENATGQELKQGLKIMVLVSIEFHESFGLSLNIKDIDPNYTLGDLAQKKAEIIKKLEDDGIISMNKEISLPIIPQKIAIISSESAAGYQDFINQIKNNYNGYKFYLKLFPSIMQGNNAENSIIHALEKIYDYEYFFDVVVIIRGGGSQSDLECFNSYTLASNIAQFPLPVITGIGHDKDESIVDIVANKKLKTPTAVAEFLIDIITEFENNILHLSENIIKTVNNLIQNNKSRITQYSTILSPLVRRKLEKYNFQLDLLKEQAKNKSIQNINSKKYKLFQNTESLKNKQQTFINKNIKIINQNQNKLKSICALSIQKQKHNIENKTDRLELLNPENVLKRGYSITYSNGKSLKKIENVKKNDEIITRLYSGTIYSKVNKKTKQGKK